MSKELNFRRGRVHKPVDHNGNLFQRITHSINKMSGAKFSFIVLMLVGAIVSVLFFAPISARNAINNVINIPNVIDTNANCNDLLNPACWTDSFFPSLPETDGLTNALLIGLDTREGESGLMNTDTIMLASYDHEKKKVFLYSFPRDLYVPYEINGKGPYYQKINAIYAAGETNKNLDGMTLLKENIEEWFGMEIHYTAKVNFNTVTDIVDALGGITIALEEDYTDVYPYKELSPELQKDCKRAVDLPLYCVFKFEKGEHELDGEHALIYARMRQYSSDFDRARRQQQVVSAIKSKFLEGDLNLIDKAKFAWDTYSAIMDKDNVESNLKYNDLIGAMRLVDKADLNPIQIVLDPSFGGGGYFVPDSVNGMYVVKLKGNSFDSAVDYIDNLKQYPDVYQEKANILLVNASGTQTSEVGKLSRAGIPFGTVNIVPRTKSEESGVVIYVFENTKVETLNFLKEYFNTTKVRFSPEDWSITQSGYKEDILVVEGPMATPTPSASITE